MDHISILKAKTKDALILTHIKAENSYRTKNFVDKNHTNLFRGYTTLIGYKKRIKKYHPNTLTLFPYGTAIYPICLIMSNSKNAELAYMESDVQCKHPQSTLACNAVIQLFQTQNMDTIKELVKDNKQLLMVCEDPKVSNTDFLAQWVVHYFAAVIYAFNGWPPNNFLKSSILSEIFIICHKKFHNGVNPPLSISERGLTDE